MDKDKLKKKYGVAGAIAVLMQVQMALVGCALILTGYGITVSFNARPRLIVYCLQAITCIAILVFGLFHFHKKKTVYFKWVVFAYAALEAVRCALLGTTGVDPIAAVATRLIMVALACLSVLLGEHLGERRGNFLAALILFLEGALYLIFAFAFSTDRLIFKLLPLVGILIAGSLYLFNVAKVKQKEYFDSLRASGELPPDDSIAK